MKLDLNHIYFVHWNSSCSSETHIKRSNTSCGQNSELINSWPGLY